MATKTTLRIMFWNTRSIKDKQIEIQRTLNNYDIIICVETWLNANLHIQFPGFFTLRKDRQHGQGGGGIAFFIRKNLAFIELTKLISPDLSVELCGIKITNVLPTIDIIACYRTPGVVLSQNQWDVIGQNVTNDNTILIGDFNSHNTI